MSSRSGRFPQAIALGSLLLALATSAHAIDLTGTWEGKFVCDSFFGMKNKFKDKGQQLQISQFGDNITVRWVGGFDLEGFVIEELRKPEAKGEVALAQCGTDGDLFAGEDEMVWLRARANASKATGTLKGESIYAPGGLEMGSCKWRFKRIDTIEPFLPSC